jgi:hypothetical protein
MFFHLPIFLSVFTFDSNFWLPDFSANAFAAQKESRLDVKPLQDYS